MSNYTKKAIYSLIIVFTFGFLANAAGYFLRVVLARSLSPEEYGLIYSIFALFGLVSIFQNLGLNDALVNFISKFNIKKQPEKIKKCMIFSIVVQIIVSSLDAIMFILLSGWLSEYYLNYPGAKILIIIYAIGIFLSPIEAWFGSIFQAFQHIRLYSMVGLFRALFLLSTTYLLIKMNFGIASAVIPYVAVYVLSFFLYLPIMLRIFPFFKTRASKEKSFIKSFIKYGLSIMLTGVAGMIISYTDTFMITLFRSLKEVGMYNAALPTATILWFVSGSILAVVFPITSELWHSNKKHLIKDGLGLLYKYCFVALVPLAAVFFCFPEVILNLLFGSTYLPAANALRVLAIASVLYNIAGINSSVLSGIGKPHVYSKLMIIAAVLNVLLNLVLIPWLGFFGATVSMVISFAFLMLASLYNLEKIIKIKAPISDWGKITLFGLIGLGIVFLLKSILNMNPWIELIVCCIVAGIVYISLLFFSRVIEFKEIKELIQRVLK
jgi:O-antigen/teichoic acid export membrane protein